MTPIEEMSNEELRIRLKVQYEQHLTIDEIKLAYRYILNLKFREIMPVVCYQNDSKWGSYWKDGKIKFFRFREMMQEVRRLREDPAWEVYDESLVEVEEIKEPINHELPF